MCTAKMTLCFMLDLLSWYFCHTSIMILHSHFLVQEEAISGSRVEEISIALYSSSSSSTRSEQPFSLSIGEIKVNVKLNRFSRYPNVCFSFFLRSSTQAVYLPLSPSPPSATWNARMLFAPSPTVPLPSL